MPHLNNRSTPSCLDMRECLFVYLLLFYVLATPKVILGWVQTCDSVQAWWSGCQHHDLISPSITLSWPCANQCLPNSNINNAEHLARKRQVSIFLSHWVDSTKVRTHDRPHVSHMFYLLGHPTWSEGRHYILNKQFGMSGGVRGPESRCASMDGVKIERQKLLSTRPDQG